MCNIVNNGNLNAFAIIKTIIQKTKKMFASLILSLIHNPIKILPIHLEVVHLISHSNIFELPFRIKKKNELFDLLSVGMLWLQQQFPWTNFRITNGRNGNSHYFQFKWSIFQLIETKNGNQFGITRNLADCDSAQSHLLCNQSLQRQIYNGMQQC